MDEEICWAGGTGPGPCSEDVQAGPACPHPLHWPGRLLFTLAGHGLLCATGFLFFLRDTLGPLYLQVPHRSFNQLWIKNIQEKRCCIVTDVYYVVRPIMVVSVLNR